LAAIGADSKSSPTIVGRNWLDEQRFQGTEQQMDQPLHPTGLETRPLAIEKYVNLKPIDPWETAYSMEVQLS
jgi:hypothetical protein